MSAPDNQRNNHDGSQVSRLLELDGLRALSISLVLGAHLLPLGPKILRLNEAAGAMGMSLFFSLSGFLIASRLLTSPTIKDFLVRRGARILPLTYLYLFLVAALYDGNAVKALWSALFVINYKTEYLTGLTAHLWSLCVEVQFYIALALIVLATGRRGVWLVWPFCIIITLLRVDAGAFIDIRTHLRVDEILAGSCVACIFHKFGKHNSTLPSGVLALTALFWGLCSHPLSGALQYARPYASALVLAATIWTGPSVVKSLLMSRPARYIAEISYALYVIHPATAFGWMNEGTIEVRYLIKRPISFLVTFILAHISTFYWEKMWTNWAKAWLARRKVIR